MHARMRWWLITILVLVIASAVGVTEPIKLQDRRNPTTGRPVKPLTRVGPFRIYRPHFGVTLGLDLRGGSHLVLQAQGRAVYEFALPDLTQPLSEDEQTELYAKIVTALDPKAIGTAKREVRLDLNDDRTLNRVFVETQLNREVDANAEVKSQGKKIAALLTAAVGKAELKKDEALAINMDDLSGIEAIIEQRVNAYGVTEPVIQRQPPDRLIVELPGVKDPEKAKELIRQTAVLELRQIPRKYAFGEQRQPKMDEVGGQEVFIFTDPTGDQVPTEKVVDESPVLVTGRELEPTSKVFSMAGQKTAVTFELKKEAGKRFEEFTRTHVDHYLAIVLDGKMVSCPIIQETISGGHGQISGGFDSPGGLVEARDLSILLNAGALPFDLEYIENRTVSAQLGQDALTRSLYAGMAGLVLVLLFMAVWYRLPGLLADLALIIYIILLMGAIKLVNQVLTLPGILAVILSVGMAVDANVIIFERLKEEIRSGKTMRSAVEAAFARAWTAILDSNVCSMGTGLVLLWFGTGPIKGFAVALIIGVAVSLFTAITVTRLFMNMVVGTSIANNTALFGVSPRELEQG